MFRRPIPTVGDLFLASKSASNPKPSSTIDNTIQPPLTAMEILTVVAAECLSIFVNASCATRYSVVLISRGNKFLTEILSTLT